MPADAPVHVARCFPSRRPRGRRRRCRWRRASEPRPVGRGPRGPQSIEFVMSMSVFDFAVQGIALAADRPVIALDVEADQPIAWCRPLAAAGEVDDPGDGLDGPGEACGHLAEREPPPSDRAYRTSGGRASTRCRSGRASAFQPPCLRSRSRLAGAVASPFPSVAVGSDPRAAASLAVVVENEHGRRDARGDADCQEGEAAECRLHRDRAGHVPGRRVTLPESPRQRRTTMRLFVSPRSFSRWISPSGKSLRRSPAREQAGLLPGALLAPAEREPGVEPSLQALVEEPGRRGTGNELDQEPGGSASGRTARRRAGSRSRK